MKKCMLLLMGLLLVAGCRQGGTPEPEVVPPVSQEAVDKVVAEGSIEPARWSELSFEDGGTVFEVLVEEGDVVSEGDLLVRLDPVDLKLAVQEAEAALALAKARLTQAKAGPRPEEIAVAEARLVAAQSAISQAAAGRDRLTDGETEADIAAVQEQVAAAIARQYQAERTHDRMLKCFEFKGPDGKKIEICPTLGRPEEFARFELQAADAELLAARLEMEATQNRAGTRLRAAEADVWSAAAQRDVSQAQLDLTRAGSTPEEIAAAEAEVTEAEAALATAKAALEHTEIYAPFAGTVTKVEVEVGETATSDQVVVVLATLDQLQVRTTDLTELDVARVAEGQPVVVTVDALPDRPLNGHVTRIDEQSEDYRGDVVYPVIVALDETAPELRWGMTVMVEIEVE